MLVVSLNRYYSFYSSYDQGLFNQVFWNSVHGHLFQSSLSSGQSSAVLDSGQIATASYYHLGQHFVLDFLLWLPLYALFPNCATLVVLQVALITAAGIVLFVLSRCYLPFSIAALITASFYGSIAVMAPLFGNFYEACQIPLFVFSLLLALEKRRWALFWLFFTLTLGIREDTGFITFSIGIYLIFLRRHFRLGLALCGLSFSYIALATNVMMPLFSDDSSRLYVKSYFQQYVQGENPSTLQLLWGIISHPQELLKSLLIPFDRRVQYFLLQWLPLAFVPALSPAAWMLTAFPLLELLLQKSDKALGINMRYALNVVPGLFYGAILWWSSHQHQFKLRLSRFWKGCIALSIVVAITTNGQGAFYFLIPDFGQPALYVSLSRQWSHASQIQGLINLIPSQASVSATAFLIPHLSGRREIIELANDQSPSLVIRNAQGETTTVEYILADLWHLERYQVSRKPDRQRLQVLVPLIDKLIVQQKYGIVKVQDKVVLLQKAAPSALQAQTDWLKLRAELNY
ncbi:MAG TPA: DUF2079 domain-containing protein [Leptolyngbya sp.]|nr:DUF2079 domain-containing protein [Leptolyngbya sp.]